MRSRVLRLGAAVVLCALAGCRTAPVFLSGGAAMGGAATAAAGAPAFRPQWPRGGRDGTRRLQRELHWEQQGTRSRLMLAGR